MSVMSQSQPAVNNDDDNDDDYSFAMMDFPCASSPGWVYDVKWDPLGNGNTTPRHHDTLFVRIHHINKSTSYQQMHILSTNAHPINKSTSYQQKHILSTKAHPINTPYQHNINTLIPPSFSPYNPSIHISYYHTLLLNRHLWWFQ